MSGFVLKKIDVGSKQPIHPFKHCDKCEQQKPPEGGIQMSPTKWYCAYCWARRVTVRNLK